MSPYFVLLVATLTSLGAVALGVRRLGLPGRALGAAAGAMLEAVGISVVFLLVNFAVGAAVILGLRVVTSWFVSIYILDDVSWLGVALVQGLTFQAWRARG